MGDTSLPPLGQPSGGTQVTQTSTLAVPPLTFSTEPLLNDNSLRRIPPVVNENRRIHREVIWNRMDEWLDGPIGRVPIELRDRVFEGVLRNVTPTRFSEYTSGLLPTSDPSSVAHNDSHLADILAKDGDSLSVESNGGVSFPDGIPENSGLKENQKTHAIHRTRYWLEEQILANKAQKEKERQEEIRKEQEEREASALRKAKNQKREAEKNKEVTSGNNNKSNQLLTEQEDQERDNRQKFSFRDYDDSYYRRNSGRYDNRNRQRNDNRKSYRSRKYDYHDWNKRNKHDYHDRYDDRRNRRSTSRERSKGRAHSPKEKHNEKKEDKGRSMVENTKEKVVPKALDLNITGRKSRFGNIPGAGENHHKDVEMSQTVLTIPPPTTVLTMPPPTTRIVSSTIHNDPQTNNERVKNSLNSGRGNKTPPVEPADTNNSVRPEHESTPNNYFESWLWHTSDLEDDSYVKRGEENQVLETEFWRSNTKFISKDEVTKHQLFLWMVDKNHKDKCCDERVDPPSFIEIPPSNRNRYGAGLFVVTHVDNDAMKARCIGIILNNHLLIGNSVRNRKVESKLPPYLWVPKSRSMAGLIPSEIEELILIDSKPPKDGHINQKGSDLNNNQNNNNSSNNNSTSYSSNNQNTSSRKKGDEHHHHTGVSVSEVNELISSKLNEKKESIHVDLNGVGYTEANFKVSVSNTRNIDELGVVKRQCQDETRMVTLLGNTLLPICDFAVLSSTVLLKSGAGEIVKNRLKRVFRDATIFKNVVLWNWSLEESMELDVFLTPGNTRINSIELLKEAIENFEEFLVIVFGECWERCTDSFRKKFKTDDGMLVLTYSYLKYSFIRVCKKMYGIMRQRIVSMSFGPRWAKLFVEEIESMELTWQNQLTWQRIEGLANNKEEEHNSSKSLKDDLLAKQSGKTVENPTKQICFAFLGKELGISDTGCTRVDCKRAHQDVFHWTKPFVIGQLMGMDGHGDLIQAVQSSKKFV
jgi:hypothetical protein